MNAVYTMPASPRSEFQATFIPGDGPAGRLPRFARAVVLTVNPPKLVIWLQPLHTNVHGHFLELDSLFRPLKIVNALSGNSTCLVMWQHTGFRSVVGYKREDCKTSKATELHI